MKTFFLLTFFQISLCKFFEYGRPRINSYDIVQGVTPYTRPDSDYLYVYNPVTRIYTYAPKEHFAAY